MLNEKWKSVVGYEGLYEVSDLGNLRSYNRGKVKPMKVNKTKLGYMKLNLSKECVVKSCRVHRLVCEAFLDNIDNKPEVNHIDGNKGNNKVSNLEWCTSSENKIHSLTTGLLKPHKAQKHWASKLDRFDIKFIDMWKSLGYSQISIADCFGVSASTISEIVNNKRYTRKSLLMNA